MTIAATGVAANNIQRCFVSGQTGSFSVTGTTTGKSIVDIRVLGSVYIHNNDTSTSTFNDIDLMSNSFMSIQNLTVAKSYLNITATARGKITINNPTGTGTVQNIHVRDNGTLFINGAAGGINGVDVVFGTLTINGGTSHVNISKSMSGALTTGNFSHIDIYHHSIVPQTLTAANTGTGRDYFNNTLV
jgi:hypothetical protein